MNTNSVSVLSNELLIPSINFSMVCPGVYRSGYPTKKNYRFLQAMRLRSILYLCPEDYAESNLKFCEENGVRVLRFPTEGNKEPFLDINELLMHRILSALCDTRNHPILIHCNKGKHRTGTVVACLRLIQGWSLVSVFDEYRRFAGDKARVGDQQYIELYRPIVMLAPPYVPEWVAPTPLITIVFTEAELDRQGQEQLSASLLAGEAPTALPSIIPPLPAPYQSSSSQQSLSASPAASPIVGGGGGGRGASITPSANGSPVNPITTPSSTSTSTSTSSPSAAAMHEQKVLTEMSMSGRPPQPHSHSPQHQHQHQQRKPPTAHGHSSSSTTSNSGGGGNGNGSRQNGGERDKKHESHSSAADGHGAAHLNGNTNGRRNGSTDAAFNHSKHSLHRTSGEM